MTKVIITVAQHSVEVDADVPLAEVSRVAMRLYRASVLPARSIPVGFDLTGPSMERAPDYIEPQPDQGTNNGGTS